MQQDNVQIKDEIIAEILDTTIISYKQETERSNLLLTKSDYLVKYITSTFVFLNAISVLMITNNMINKMIIVFMYLIVGVALCMALVKAVSAQILLKGKYFPTAGDILNGIVEKGEFDDDKIKKKLIKDKLGYYTQYTKELESANNERAKKINIAYKIYIGGVVGIVVGIMMIMIIIA